MKSFKEFIVESPEDEIAANLARGRDAHKAEYPDGDKHGDAVYAKYKADKAAKAAGAPSKDPHGDAAYTKYKADKAANTPKAPTKDLNDMSPNERARHKRQVGYDLKAAQDKLVGVRATNKVNVGVANAVADVKQGLNNADVAGRRAEQTVATAKFDSSINSLRNKVNDNILRADTAIKNVQSAQSSPRSDIDGSGRPDPNKPRTPRDRSKDRVTMNPSYELIPGGRRRIQRPDAPARVEDNWMRDYIRGQGKKKYETPKTPNKPMPGDGSTSIKPRNPRNPNSPIPRFGRKQSDNPINTKMSERIRKNIINRPRQ